MAKPQNFGGTAPFAGLQGMNDIRQLALGGAAPWAVPNWTGFGWQDGGGAASGGGGGGAGKKGSNATGNMRNGLDMSGGRDWRRAGAGGGQLVVDGRNGGLVAGGGRNGGPLSVDPWLQQQQAAPFGFGPVAPAPLGWGMPYMRRF